MQIRHITAAAAAALVLSGAAAEARTLNITVVAGHPPITIGVAQIRDYFIPEVDRRLAETGDYRINWVQAYGGSVAPPSGVLEAVRTGIGDMGYVPHLFERDKLPLEQITFLTPFGTDDLALLMDVVEKLQDEVPEMEAAWTAANQKLLAGVGIDTYHFVTKAPVNSVEDLRGLRLGTAGLGLNWLRDTGAIPVGAALPDYYNSMATGLMDGIVTFESAVLPYKFHEVAPHITRVNFGAMYSSGLTINLDVWNRLPEDVQNVMLEVASEYQSRTAQAYVDSGARSLAAAEEAGATVADFPEEERAKLAAMLPNIAREWAAGLDQRGLPGTRALETYIRLSQEAGITFARDWLAE
ncbi:MAG: C4-dicarboxylate TRAP transporter substrate-binding protein [Rhodobacteraceae bacterium]|nr:C4-dicarboxylate TRAP transporter substrate-binding protein [Paracoccaceae bacterium]